MKEMWSFSTFITLSEILDPALFADFEANTPRMAKKKEKPLLLTCLILIIRNHPQLVLSSRLNTAPK